METNRRIWLKHIGLIAAGIGLAQFETIASPLGAAPLLLLGSNEAPIRLSSNENPYGPSPAAREAMSKNVNISNRYQWQMILDLITSIAEKYNLTSDNVLVGAGSTQMIDACIQYAAFKKGNFIIAEPTFSRWAPAAQKSGLRKIAVPLNSNKKHDLDAMLKAIKPDTRMIYVCNPNNPTGTVCKYEDLVAFVKEASKKVLVVIDEAYLEYSNATSLSSFVSENENLVVIKTFSKIFGMAGARIGYALGHIKIIQKINQLQSGANIGISAVSLAGAMASLKDSDFVKQSIIKNEKARTFTIAEMEQLDIRCIPSHTNFIYFSLTNYKKDFFGLLKANNIEGTNIFEDDGKWSRITVGTMDEMKKFIGAIG